MKALIEKQGQRPPRIHDLKKLHAKLPNTIRQKIDDKVAASGLNLSRVENLLTEHRNSLEEWRYMGDFGSIQVIELGAIAATLKAIVEVHVEEYGAEMGQSPPDSKGVSGVPLSIQDAASEYAKEVFNTDVSNV